MHYFTLIPRLDRNVSFYHRSDSLELGEKYSFFAENEDFNSVSPIRIAVSFSANASLFLNKLTGK
jgi:hypothetical protein